MQNEVTIYLTLLEHLKLNEIPSYQYDKAVYVRGGDICCSSEIDCMVITITFN